MYIAPPAPHVELTNNGWQPPSPAARHANLYANDKVSPAFACGRSATIARLQLHGCSC